MLQELLQLSDQTLVLVQTGALLLTAAAMAANQRTLLQRYLDRGLTGKAACCCCCCLAWRVAQTRFASGLCNVVPHPGQQPASILALEAACSQTWMPCRQPSHIRQQASSLARNRSDALPCVCCARRLAPAEARQPRRARHQGRKAHVGGCHPCALPGGASSRCMGPFAAFCLLLRVNC